MRNEPWAVVAATTGWLAMSVTVLAENKETRVTVDVPARLTIAQPHDLADRQVPPSRLIISVTGFQPSPNGPVTAVVTVSCGGKEHEIGRFGVFPQAAFPAAGSASIQRFGFDLPKDAACGRSASATIRLEPSVGDGRDASMLIGKAVYQ